MIRKDLETLSKKEVLICLRVEHGSLGWLRILLDFLANLSGSTMPNTFAKVLNPWLLVGFTLANVQCRLLM